MPRRPNILWICTDQQRFDTLGCYGNRFVRTPNLDRLAADGLRFENAFCQCPVCSPSRASMLTGRYPRTIGCYQNGQCLPNSERLISRLLADAGYSCGLIGKLHLSACHPSAAPVAERRMDDGYSFFVWSHHPARDWPANAYCTWLDERRIRLSTAPFRGSRYVQAGMPAHCHHTTWTAERAAEFIQAAGAADQPWLCSVNFFDPHHPFDAPAEYLDRLLDRGGKIPLPNFFDGELENKPAPQRIDHRGAYGGTTGFAFAQMADDDHRLVTAAYWAMCELIDDAVGMLLATLRRSRQADNTLVIFTSDHGEMLGDHGIYFKGPYFYDPAIRVPLIIANPGAISGGRTCPSLVELVDLAPTLMQAAGIEPTAGMQGRSLWPWLTGRTPRPPERSDVYCEYYNSMDWHRDPPPMATMLRSATHKLVVFHAAPGNGPIHAPLQPGELYDLQSDPSETHNRWSDPACAAIKAELLHRLCDRVAWTVDTGRPRVAGW